MTAVIVAFVASVIAHATFWFVRSGQSSKNEAHGFEFESAASTPTIDQPRSPVADVNHLRSRIDIPYPVAGESQAIVKDLREALKRQELVLHYQPKASVRTGEVSEVEALIRWCHPTWGWISPDHFIPLAERCGLIQPLSRFVLNAVVEQSRTWHEAGLSVTIAANLSMLDLQEPSLPQTLSKLLRRHDLDARWLRIEVTESAVMADPKRTLEVFGTLSDMGVGLSLDDFGTGYSSLAHLRRLPVDEVKLDKSFVTDVADDTTDAAIVRNAINLSHELGLQVVAEGVENQAVWDALSLLGCDTVQGFFLSRPLPAAQFEQWLVSRHNEQPRDSGTRPSRANTVRVVEARRPMSA